MHRLFLLVPVVLFFSILAIASGKNAAFPVKVVATDSRVQQDSIAADCNFEDYDGYCNAATPVVDRETSLTLKEKNGDTLRIACEADDADCASLPINETVNARFVKGGLEIRYVNQNEKVRLEVVRVVPDVTAVGD